MTELRTCDWNKVIDFDIAKELVDELGACEKDEAIYEELKRYALKIAEEDDRRGGWITLFDLFNCMDRAFMWEAFDVADELDWLKTEDWVTEDEGGIA